MTTEWSNLLAMTVLTLAPIALVFMFLQNTSPPALHRRAANNPQGGNTTMASIQLRQVKRHMVPSM